MKSIPLALTWEFWRQAWAPLLAVVTILYAFLASLYGTLSIGNLYNGVAGPFGSLHIFCFLFVLIALSSVICQLTESPRYRFTLPVSIHGSISVPMLNGAVAAAIGYLVIALLLNWCFNAQWTLLKPTIIVVCVHLLCQASAWTVWSVPRYRGALVAGISTLLGVGVMFAHDLDSIDQLGIAWHTTRPIDVACAVLVPAVAYGFSVIVLTLARHGRIPSLIDVCHNLFSKCNIRLASLLRGTSPIAAEAWADWSTKGRLLLAGPVVISFVLCCFFLTGRFEWRSGVGAIVACTWLQLIGGLLVGLFLGNVGERFDMQEHLATRPLSDTQLADIKLRNILKSVCWNLGVWAVGVALLVVCLVIVGHGPSGWEQVIRPGTHSFVIAALLLAIPLFGWTVTSLAASVAVLRPWLIQTIFLSVALFFILGIIVLSNAPLDKHTIDAAMCWSWIVFCIAGTIAIYVVASRMGLMTIRRIMIAAGGYVMLCLVCLGLLAIVPLPGPVTPIIYGTIAGNAMLPFTALAAMPVGLSWNRHR